MLYKRVMTDPTFVHEPSILIDARNRFRDATTVLAETNELLQTTVRGREDLWEEYRKISRTNNYQRMQIGSEERRSRERALTKNRLAFKTSRSKHRSRAYRTSFEASGFVTQAEKLADRRKRLEAEVVAAYDKIQAANADVRELRALLPVVRSEVQAAKHALDYFRVYPYAMPQLAGEPDEHYGERYRYLAARQQAFIEAIGIPEEFRESVDVKEKPNGDVHFFFGGTGQGDHAHYVLYASGAPSWRREPGRGQLF